MTCIVGIKQGGMIWIGGDSLGSADDTAVVRANPKVARLGPMIVGWCGSARVSQVLFYGMGIPPFDKDFGAMNYLIQVFVPALRDALSEHGVNIKDGEMDSALLVGLSHRLFEIDADFSVNEFDGDYLAMGSGEQVANGALFATRWLNMSPKARIELALYAAEHHTRSVRGPFTTISSDILGKFSIQKEDSRV